VVSLNLNIVFIGPPNEIGQRTMINWSKKDRVPTRGIHTRGGGRRKEKLNTKKYKPQTKKNDQILMSV
jgi:hypothetical protein